jgi:hypothetical protein
MTDKSVTVALYLQYILFRMIDAMISVLSTQSFQLYCALYI